ncbi:MAG: peptidylprolyl isomerase [Thermoleophilia bacterium]
MRAKRNLIFVLALSALVFLAGCGNDEKAECTLPDDAAACVDDFIITKDDVATRIEKQRKAFGAMVPAEDADGDGVLDEGFTNHRREVTRQLAREELQRREVERRGITVTDEEIHERMLLVAEDSFLGDYDAMIKDYADKGITLEELQEDVRPQLELEKLELELRADIEVTDDDALKYYQENIGQYVQPDRVTARQLIADDEATAREAVTRTRAGEPFVNVVTELSVDPAKADKKGALGLVSPGQLAPELDSALFALKVGEISEPVQVGNQWYVVAVEATVPGYDYSFEEKKEEIRYLQSNLLYSEKFKELKSRLEAEAVVTYHPDYDPELIVDRSEEEAAPDAGDFAPADGAEQSLPGGEQPIEVPQS